MFIIKSPFSCVHFFSKFSASILKHKGLHSSSKPTLQNEIFIYRIKVITGFLFRKIKK